MLNFFRRIRKGIFDGGRTSRYILYAVGEIALVVIGILIALQINNWNEYLEERSLEKETILGIRDALESDLKNIILPQLGEIHRSVSELGIILDYIDKDFSYHDSIARFFNHLTRGANFLPKITAFKTLESRGLDIILDKGIRDEILDIYSMEYPRMQSRIENHIYNIRDYGRPIFRTEFIWNRGEGAVPIDFESLKKVPEFRNTVSTIRDNNRLRAEHLMELEQKIRQLIEWIDERYS